MRESEAAREAMQRMRLGAEERGAAASTASAPAFERERLDARQLIDTSNPNVTGSHIEAAAVAQEGAELPDEYGAFDPASRSALSKREREEQERRREGELCGLQICCC